MPSCCSRCRSLHVQCWTSLSGEAGELERPDLCGPKSFGVLGYRVVRSAASISGDALGLVGRAVVFSDVSEVVVVVVE
jgi:hypothetical protein